MVVSADMQPEQTAAEAAANDVMLLVRKLVHQSQKPANKRQTLRQVGQQLYRQTLPWRRQSEAR